MLTDVIDQNLAEAQWDLVHKVAKELVLTETDVNELQKAIAYLRSVAHHEDAVERFFKYLSTLASRQGQQVAHSKRTQDYHRSLQITCHKYLEGRVLETARLLKILGWAARLMRYYQNAGPIGEETKAFDESIPPAVSQRELEIANILESRTFEIGQILDAEVEKKHSKGNKVTYLVSGMSFPFTEKEAKSFAEIPESGSVKVQIKSLKENGSINHIKYVSS